MSLLKSRFIELIGNIQNPKYQLVELNEICEFIKDGTHQTPIYTEDRVNGFKFLSSKDVTSQKINWSNIKYIQKELHEQLYAKLSPKRGDILLAKNGTTGVAAVVDSDEIFDIYVSLALLRPKSGVNVSYLCSALNSEDLKRQFNSSLKGIGVPNLHLREIKKARIIFPPIDIQNKISSITKQIDKSKFLLQQILEKFELLKKSRFIEMFGNLGNHHKDWKIAKFENFCEINPNKKSIENIEDSTEVSFIPMAAVSEKGEIDTSETKTYSEVKKGFTSFSDKDVLFAKITPCMENGKGAVAEGLKNNLGFGSTEFHVLRPKQELCDSYWLYYLMSLPEFRKKAELNMKGSAGQKRVPANFLAKFEISLPPIGLQKVYIDFFNQIDKSKFNVFQDQTAAQVKVIVVLHHIC